MTVTQGYLARHYHGSKQGGRDAAFIDIAQDHALKVLYDRGVFDHGAVLKGGTSLRKYRAGNAGRFSTDLDFSVAEADVAEMILEYLHGATLGGFTFEVEVLNERRRSLLGMSNASLGPPPNIPARIDIAHARLWLAADVLEPVPLPVHRAYDFKMPPLPIVRLEEMLAEKLARYRRHPLIRDLYDLAWCAARPFDKDLVRRITVLKVWHDVLDDQLGDAPFDPSVIVAPRQSKEFVEELIGQLTRPVDVKGWIETVRARYAFMTALTAEERQIARCSLGERYKVQQMIASLVSV